MTDLISRQAAINAINALHEKPNAWLDSAVDAVMTLPSVEPVQHEECEYVITKGKSGYHEEYKCSACGDSFYWSQDRNIPRRFNYCRNCGRKVIRFIEKEKEE